MPDAVPSRVATKVMPGASSQMNGS